ncbi:MAG TPA: creatininase family protein [Acetobacteraceae bacterium]
MEIEWRKLRAEQLRDCSARGAMVILPLGSIEQHGPHLPVEVDSMLGEQVALRTARRMTDAGNPALVLPMLWTGVSEHHMSFGGTITLDLPTYAAVVEGILRSVLRHGFRRVVLLNGHGGNENGLRCITDELTPKLGVPIVQFTYWHAAAEAIAAILETQKGLRHACEAETSMMMATEPGLIDRAALQGARGPDQDRPELEALVGPGVFRWQALNARSRCGVIGEAPAATADKGERLLEAQSARVAEVLGNKALWSVRASDRWE